MRIGLPSTPSLQLMGSGPSAKHSQSLAPEPPPVLFGRTKSQTQWDSFDEQITLSPNAASNQWYVKYEATSSGTRGGAIQGRIIDPSNPQRDLYIEPGPPLDEGRVRSGLATLRGALGDIISKHNDVLARSWVLQLRSAWATDMVLDSTAGQNPNVRYVLDAANRLYLTGEGDRWTNDVLQYVGKLLDKGAKSVFEEPARGQVIVDAAAERSWIKES